MSSLLSLISLPALSFLALPTFSSWSTSLNIAFFSMTWFVLVVSNDQFYVEVLGILFIRAIFYILPSLLFLAFDCAVPSLATNIKAQGEVALPVRNEKDKRKVLEVVGWSTFNVCLGVALQAAVELLYTEVFQMRSALKVPKTLPMPFSILFDLVTALAFRGISTYYINHHVLHSPSGGRVADWHKSWHHSIRAPYAFVANYDHPVPWILSRWLPLHAPALFFPGRTHILSFHLALALVSLEECFAYSGYSILPSILLAGMARRADNHLLSGGKGNFGPWGVLDWVHGTTVGKDVVDDVRKECDKHDVQGRASGLGDAAGGMLEDVRDRFGGNENGNGKGKGKKKVRVEGDE
ncbi:hypothetical protein H2201_007821 [Coniosporium apollinis]|uniref:Fatty acid hydroxylase domain-containing protein n=1 Tax=Coniosporium apollinis TaxID=61459 RepID=A0ABQ9NKF5_9PEZI|nr:hypothetical protein H2201_007821 [Coniosporium apollinis]